MHKRQNAYRQGIVSFDEERAYQDVLDSASYHDVEDMLEAKREAKIRRRAVIGAAAKKPLAVELNMEGCLGNDSIPGLLDEVPCDYNHGTRLKLPDVEFPPLFRKNK